MTIFHQHIKSNPMWPKNNKFLNNDTLQTSLCESFVPRKQFLSLGNCFTCLKLFLITIDWHFEKSRLVQAIRVNTSKTDLVIGKKKILFFEKQTFGLLCLPCQLSKKLSGDGTPQVEETFELFIKISSLFCINNRRKILIDKIKEAWEIRHLVAAMFVYKLSDFQISDYPIFPSWHAMRIRLYRNFPSARAFFIPFF